VVTGIVSLRRLGASVIGVAAVLAVAPLADAADPNLKPTPAGQKAARAAVVLASDLPGAASAWTGGFRKPDNSEAECSSYDPKTSDLVTIGQAASGWKRNDSRFSVSSETSVLRDASMVRKDFQRSFDDPRALPCLREIIAKSFGNDLRVLTFNQVAFPKVGAISRCYRAIVQPVAVPALRAVIDLVVVGKGRSEVTLGVTGLGVLNATGELYLPRVIAAARALEIKLVRALVARAS